jgi:putative restriction endonuclease
MQIGLADGLSFDTQLRKAAMQWLDQKEDRLVTRAELAEFRFNGERIPLIDRGRGIRKPASLDAALSMSTTFTKPGAEPPYADAEGPDGLLRYKYQGDDPEALDNISLRRCFERGLPLIWFVAIEPSKFLARYPVYLVSDEPLQLQFTVALDAAQRYLPRGDDADEDTRAYATRLSRLRLHQPVFRARVLQAYKHQCAVCRLQHTELLDAAHILSDLHPNGKPVVPNGLALCKIHHAAYDQNIIGIRPDLVVAVRPDILLEIDGPMLRHGIQEMAGTQLSVPNQRAARPDTERLDERYSGFLAAS